MHTVTGLRLCCATQHTPDSASACALESRWEPGSAPWGNNCLTIQYSSFVASHSLALIHLPLSRHPDVAAYAVLGVVAVAVSPAVLQTRPLARVRRAEPPSRLHAVVHPLHLPHKAEAAIAARLYQQHLRQFVLCKL